MNKSLNFNDSTINIARMASTPSRRISNILPTLNPSHTPRSCHVAVLMGGMSSEREVSLSSAKGIIQALHQSGYHVTPIDMGYDIASVLTTLNPDIVFNALHGTFGEDGCVPGMLNIVGIPYTHSGVLASAISMDKPRAKALFSSHGIPTPAGRVIHQSDQIDGDPLPRPYVIKPPQEGSSVGVRIVFEQDDFSFTEYTWEYSDTIMVEEYIPGKEIQAAVLGQEAIGAIEIRPHGRFYDYTTKYTDGWAEHVMPAEVDKEIYDYLLEIALQAHQLLGCRGVSRADFRYNERHGKQGVYLLEMNTHPGMTPLSLVPEIAQHHGIDFATLLDRIIEDALCRNASPCSLPSQHLQEDGNVIV